MEASGSDLSFGMDGRHLPADWQGDRSERRPDPLAVEPNRWYESAWFKEWEDLAYAHLGQG